MAIVELYGREGLLERLASTTAPVALLVGDSGTGKTAILDELQARSNAVAPAPVRVSYAPGSLQIALLESLAGAVALMAQDTSAAERIGRSLVDAASRVADTRLKDLRAAVGKHLLSLVRARVGDELADLLESFGSELTVSAEQSLAARITAASDGDVVDQIVAFAEEVNAMAGEGEVDLALDDLDRLDGGDLRRLADIAGRLPPGLRIRGSFTTWHSTSRERFEALQLGGVEGIPIPGLDERDIAAWLSEQQLDVRLVPAVIAATNGYPVHVADAIGLLHRDPSARALEALTPDEVTAVRTRQAWRELDSASQIVAAKLCVYQDPLPTIRVCSLLGLDEMAWGTLAIRLIDAGLLLDDQRRWFHELRRRVIWQDLISQEMRQVALRAATDELRTQLQLPAAKPSDFVDFARVAAENEDLQSAEAGLRAATEATPSEVAIAAAALELIEYSHGERVIDAEVLLSHARDSFPAMDDPLAALDRLVDRGLMHVESNRHAAVAVPIWGSETTVQVFLGRAAAEVGRIPVAQLATAVFESRFRSRLGSFDAVMYGVGSPSMATAANEVASLHRRPKDGVVYLGGREPGLAIRGRHGSVPLYAAVSYADPGQRDAAAEDLRQLDEDLWGEPVSVDDILALPSQVVPSLRFARALTWLDGRGDFSLHMLHPVDAQDHYSLADQVSADRNIREVVRERSDILELYAYGLEHPVGYAYGRSADGEVVVEIENGAGLVEIPADWGRLLQEPFGRLKLAAHLALEPGQHLRRVNWRSGTNRRDPVTDSIVDLRNSASRYNANQLPMEVTLDEMHLGELLREAFELREADGRALLEVLPGMGLALPDPTTTFLVLELDDPSPRWVPGAHALLHTARLPRAEGETVAIRVVGTGDGRDRRSLFEDAFGIDVTSAQSNGSGEAIGGLSKLLGYGRGELRLRYSDDQSAA